MPASGGLEFLQLQYTQTVLLNFNGLSWPHDLLATLRKVNNPDGTPILPELIPVVEAVAARNHLGSVLENRAHFALSGTVLLLTLTRTLRPFCKRGKTPGKKHKIRIKLAGHFS